MDNFGMEALAGAMGGNVSIWQTIIDTPVSDVSGALEKACEQYEDEAASTAELSDAIGASVFRAPDGTYAVVLMFGTPNNG